MGRWCWSYNRIMKFVSVERVGDRLEFRDIDRQVLGGLDLGERAMPSLPEGRVKKRSLVGRPRWKDGSLLTEQQRADENYQIRMGIS